MLDFPYVPYWWCESKKFMKLLKGFEHPHFIIGFDTETCKGEALSIQFSSIKGDDILFVNSKNILDSFLNYCKKQFIGKCVLYVFNAPFDLALLLYDFIDYFLKDKFEVRYKGWNISVFCSKNWYAYFQYDNLLIRFNDIHNYFQGSLDFVSKSFNLKIQKLQKPEDLGYKEYSKYDLNFVNYALQDAKLCYEIGKIIVGMHGTFDIPLSTSSANMSEKIFRRKFLEDNDRIQYPEFSAQRIAEITYHGGKNGYYFDFPTLVHNCYEYDFVSAYGYAMYSIPSFLSGEYKKVKTFNENYVGHYLVKGILKPCIYGVMYDKQFNYHRFNESTHIKTYVTSYELGEAIRSKEFELDSCEGWIWIPNTENNPLKNYAKYFWEKKNETKKNDVNYLFYKLCLNSLYGKWIQRNPEDIEALLSQNDTLLLSQGTEIASGMYHPFIASLITGFTRARLHNYEHKLEAIECSTDSIKTKKHLSSLNKNYFGNMKLENFQCKSCNKNYTKIDILFVRNRLNLLMDKSEHILKAALHGFWGKPNLLLKLFHNRRTNYEISRMPLIRESLKQENKFLFQTFMEERNLNIDWNLFREL